LKHDLKVDLHKSSSTTYDLHAFGFIKSLLQACLCQQFFGMVTRQEALRFGLKWQQRSCSQLHKVTNI